MLKRYWVDFVALPLYDGELGVLPGRAPLIGKLGFGEMRTQKGGETERFYVEGGFVQVRNDVVTLLTSKAARATELNAQAATALLEKSSHETATTPEAIEERLKTQQKARAQLRILNKATRED